MTQASVNISQQFKDGGVVPAKLAGQDAASKTYVDEQLAIRDTNIAAAAGAASAAQADIDQHEASTAAHPAQHITYAGDVTGAANVKQGLDKVYQRVNQIIAGGDSSAEVVDARGSYPVLGDRLNASDAQLADTVKLSEVSLNDLAYLMVRPIDNNALRIGLYGDSIYAGFDGFYYVEEKIDSTMQSTLRSYYGNSSVTVINHSIQGRGTNSELPGWDTAMETSDEDIIYINYGVNDVNGTPANEAITADQYRLNLLEMVSIAKKHNKVVILDTPNFILNIGDRQKNADTAVQFAAVMRDVAKFTNCPLVDSSYWLEKLLESSPRISDWLPDGIHLSQKGNRWKARLMLSFLIQPHMTKASRTEVIGVGSPKFRVSPAETYLENPGSIVGWEVVGNKISFGVFVDTPNLDLYIASIVWNLGALSASVKVNGEVIGAISFNDADVAALNYTVVDQEIMIVKNLPIGCHFVEIDGGASPVGMTYARVYPSRIRKLLKQSSSSFTYKEKVLENPIINTSSAGYNTILTDIQMSRLISDVTLEVRATLKENEGIVLFGHRVGGNVGLEDPVAGILAWLGTGGVLVVSEPTTPGNYSNHIIGSSDLRGTEHMYRIHCSTSGEITFFVDGIQVGSHAQTKPYIGGFFGFWKAGSGSMNIREAFIY